ncbi:hypothetical protein [Streptomyces sp. KN37]|uniref:hypothetical protein n=1 Tax=Streptomyces sp. KN37 TaxID=3090667 RepID=UPI002A762708|nr:hypothetical protein [Streptomyces sp. KN37]WPO73977.1 hypothetical protein R9806_26845 [Streptomyces sp. KN37]
MTTTDATEDFVLRRRVDALTEQNTRLQAELRGYKELAAALADRLTVVQRDNEAAYRQAYEAANGPHFCTGQPVGSLTARPRPGIRDLAQGGPS